VSNQYQELTPFPIPIIWRLINPLSAALYRSFSILRDA
jgi:hypothetical protein